MGLRGVKPGVNCKCGAPRSTTKTGRLCQFCKSCKVESEHKWKRENPERWRHHQKNARLKREYGINIDDFNAMFTDQEGRCAICSRQMVVESIVSPDLACVDHNHDTGNLRELLCYNCNSGLGMFKERPETFLAAIAYLEKHAV